LVNKNEKIPEGVDRSLSSVLQLHLLMQHRAIAAGKAGGLQVSVAFPNLCHVHWRKNNYKIIFTK